MTKVVSNRGVVVDMGRLKMANQHKVALGNAGLNARGDKVTNRGEILATREQYMSDYNHSNPKAVKQIGLSSIHKEVMMSPSEAAAKIHGRSTTVEPQKPQPQQHKRKIADSEV